MSPYYPYMLRPQHSFVRANSGQTSYTFVIPMTDCGTRIFDNDEDGSAGFQNMIMIQTEEVVQELWDAARQIICDWTTRMEKLVTFRPFTVDVLQAREVRYSGDDVMCWMDIQLGEGPFSTSLDGIVKIGDQLAVVIYVQDGGLEYDMLVKNCFAYDSQDVEDERTTQLRLTNERGCLLKPKLMSSFRRTRNTGSSGADIIAYASLFAFKFPDKMDVFLSCEVELCTGGCTSTCEEDPGLPSSLMSLMEPTTTTTSLPPPPSTTTTNPCLTRPGSPQCCARNPSHTACVTTTTADPCGDNLNLPQCCARDPTLPQCTTTTTTATTTRLDPCAGRPGSFECCMRNPNHPQCIARIPSTPTTSRPGPCDVSPGSLLCCATSPDHPACAATTTRPTTTTTRPTTRPTTTTTRPTTTPRADSCVSDPGSSVCCVSDPSHASCVEQTPCSSPRDPRPQCQSTTTPPSTTTTPPSTTTTSPSTTTTPLSTTTTSPSTTIDPENRATSGNVRQRRPAYGTRLSPEILALLAQTRRRRDVALPLPVRNTVAMMRGFRVVGANDLTFPTSPVPRLSASYVDSVCLPRASFTVGLLMLSMVAITAVLVATVTSLRLRALAPYKTAEATNFYYKQ